MNSIYNSNKYSIITLTPKKTMTGKLIECMRQYKLSPDKLESYLNEETLLNHSVPVFTPFFYTPREFSLYIKHHAAMLFDIMLTAWPFANKEFGLNLNHEALFNYMDITYYPVVLGAFETPNKNSLDLSATLAVPTKELVDFIEHYKNTAHLNEDERGVIDFLAVSGIALVSNKIERPNDSDLNEWLISLADVTQFLAPLGDKILATLFSIYFKSEASWPKERDDQYLEKWFYLKTVTGIYQIPDE